MILLSANSVAFASEGPTDNPEAPEEVVISDKVFTVVSSGVKTMYCYWWKDGEENGFVPVDSVKTKGSVAVRNFVIPGNAVGAILTKENQWKEESDNADIKLTPDLALTPELSNHLFIDLRMEGPKQVTDFVDTALTVPAQGSVPNLKPGDSVDLVAFGDLAAVGSLVTPSYTVDVYDNGLLLKTLKKNDVLTYTADALGTRTIKFGVKNILGETTYSATEYTVECAKAAREPLSFSDEVPFEIEYGTPVAVPQVAGLADDETVVYTSSDNDVVTVSGDMLVPVAPGGPVVITATVAESSSYLEASVSFETNVVEGRGVNHVEFLHADAEEPVEIRYGETYSNPVVYNITDENAVINYSSSDETIARVDDNGLVTAVAASDQAVTITATVTNMTYLSDAVISYTLKVNKADYELKVINTKVYVYEPGLTVKASDSFKNPLDGDCDVNYTLVSQMDLKKNEITNAAEINGETGELTVKRSGFFRIRALITSANYVDKTIEFNIRVDKAKRNVKYQEDKNSARMYVGRTYNMDPPVALEGVVYSISDEDRAYAKISGNTVTALKEKKDGVTVTARIAADDCYLSESADFTLFIDSFEPEQELAYSVSGTKAFPDDDTKYVSDVTLTANKDYQIALYDESIEDYTKYSFTDSIAITHNVQNPKIVLKYVKPDDPASGAISGVIDTNIFVDKTAPTGAIHDSFFNSSFKELFPVITFELFTPETDFKITAEDKASEYYESGMASVGKIKYFVDENAEKSKTYADLDALEADQWTTYVKPFNVTFEDADVVIYAKLTDAFGNYSYICTNGFVFDTIHPVINASYDNNNVKNGKYFDAERTLTLRVEEKNFAPNDGMFTITAKSTDGTETPLKVNWTGNTGTVKFTDEGEYTVVFGDVVDKAGNIYVDGSGTERKVVWAEDTKASETFVIDKTAPQVTVSYDNNDCRDGYFKSSRKATVTVVDHNFAPVSDMITITAQNAAGNKLDVPKVIWAASTATVSFDREGEYSVAIADSFMDLAGNKPEVVTSDGTVNPYQFIIDKTSPTVELSFDNNDVLNEKYFNRNRTAVIKVNEDYFTPASDMIVVTAETLKGEKLTPPTPKWDGNVATVEFVEDAKYTLSVSDKLTDRAGNPYNKLTVAEGTKCANDFIIDKTNVKALLSFDNNNVANGKYFKAGRTAKIEVDDDSFVGSEKMFRLTAKDNLGKNIKKPAVIWNGNTATISFEADGVYTLATTDDFVDLAGNPLELSTLEGTESPYEFVIDTVSPLVTAVFNPKNGVNEKYFSSTRTATFSIKDDNFSVSASMFTITAKDVNGKDVENAYHFIEETGENRKSIQIEFAGNANYTVKLNDKFRDFAGNKFVMDQAAPDSYEFCVDKSLPTVSIKYYNTEEMTGFFDELKDKFTDETPYFPGQVIAEITAIDADSGINRITHYASVKGNESGLKGQKTETAYNKDRKDTFTIKVPIDPEFKGIMIATAVNNAEQSSVSGDKVIAISEKKPQISLEILNKKAPNLRDGVRYYAEDIKVCLTVEDVFFDAVGKKKVNVDKGDFNLVVKETTDSEEPVLLDVSGMKWERIDNTNRYQTTIVLSKEGKKKLEVSYRNNVDKKADPANLTGIGLDKENPTAVIEYDNNAAANGNFYQENRTATISVKDVNFEFTGDAFDQTSANKMFEITATHLSDTDGEDIQPKVVISKDKQTATLLFTENGHYTVKTTDKFTDFAKNPVELSVADKTENAYDFFIDHTAPEELTITYSNDSSPELSGSLKDILMNFFPDSDAAYFPDKVTVTIKAKDSTSGIRRIQYLAPLYSAQPIEEGLAGVDIKTEEYDDIQAERIVTFEIPAEFKGRVEASAYNFAERMTASNEDNIAISEMQPEISLEILNEKDPIVHDKISYYDRDVQIRVYIRDVFFDRIGKKKDQTQNNLVITEATNAEGSKPLDINAFEWKRAANPDHNKDRENLYYADITLSREGKKAFAVAYTNNVGKKAATQTITDFVIDKTAPVVDISFDNNNPKNDKYFDAPRKVTVKVTDDFFVGTDEMIRLTEARKTGPVEMFDYVYNWNGTKQTAEIVFSEDAFYTFNLSDAFVDLAGNAPDVRYAEGTAAANDFVIDKTAPDELEILIKESTTDNVVNDVKLGDAIENKTIFCNKTVDILLSANDALLSSDELTVQYTVACSDKNYAVAEITNYTDKLIYSPNKYFVITAYVTDKAGNMSVINSDKIVLDETAPEIDGISPEIKLNVNSNQPKIDRGGNKLYNGNVIVDFVITDREYNNSCSGLNLDELKYSVLNNGLETQSGILSGKISEYDGRPQVLAGSILVDANLNNSNNVELIVYAMDNAANASKDSAKLRIDITNPTINVSYSNDSPDSTYTKYFNASRRATIEIAERNFNEDKVIVKMTKNTAEVTPSLTWTHTGDPSSDSYLHTAYIDYDEDADYTFDITYTDEASNPAEAVNYGSSVSPTEFTIDQTIPTIEITYDNNSAVNGNYYARNRVATITITEHNFDESRVTFTCTAQDNGASVTAPTLSGWSTSGDVHTATVSFNVDAYFVMNIAFTDMAGNKAADVQEQTFYVDTKKPAVRLEGIENRSANSGEDDIGFTLTTSDHNLNASTYDMKIRRVDFNADNSSIFDGDHEMRTRNEITYSVQNLPDDGIYMITCEVSDMAGNHTSTSEMVNSKNQPIKTDDFLFSVNRFGSTFMIDDRTQNIVDKGYIQEVTDDVLITEINPDKIDSYSISLKKNDNQPITLSVPDNYERTTNDENDALWKTYTYRVKKAVFEDEAGYSLALTTTDSANNSSFSETKNPDYTDVPVARIDFIVDRTIPQVIVNNLEDNGHYNIDTQTVDIIATDDNLLKSVTITLNDEVIKEYTEEELVANAGKMSLDIPSSSSVQNLRIEAIDAANNSTDNDDDTAIVIKNFLVTTNLFIQFINSPVLVISSIAGVLLIAGLVVFLISRKKKGKKG